MRALTRCHNFETQITVKTGSYYCRMPQYLPTEYRWRDIRPIAQSFGSVRFRWTRTNEADADIIKCEIAYMYAYTEADTDVMKNEIVTLTRTL